VSPTQVEDDVAAIAKRWKSKRGSLIMALHGLQDRYGYVPRGAAMNLAEEMGVPLARIYEVLTFYNYFRLKSPGRHVVSVCMGTACYLKGAPKLLERASGALGIAPGETTPDGAVAHGLGNVETVLSRVREARDAETEPPYHFIEVMACPGGCVGGGGQPYGVTDKLRAKRAAGLYQDDQAGLWRCAHENPYIAKLYQDFLGEPLGEKSEQLLHTSYHPRPTYRR